ncbi:capsular biosynthesis protein [Albimonas sp. CAU 1670]|uniref:capsular biosynthesis protein n=1 Tax=Albimonas sp. CAU 1670 TaxID=3032599 RepID=UPI0023DAF184|nr:capsular biosynthesis protein [Albimonas sp. CAU 1670]MDF2233870.1 capsular biosynthesis protein [Albimonas sp. CAU 1670]
MGERCALLLQGPSSPFFSHLGDALEARGARVLRLHLSPGDALFWRRGGGRSYRGSFDDWPRYVADFMAREGVTDLVLLGDNRPLHRPAVDRAKATGVRVHHVELGYVRPDWLTVEPDGGGAAAPFPTDWAAIEALAARGELPQERRLYRSSFAAYAAMDVAWNLTNLALSWATHPGYRRHQTWHPLAEYGGFLWKMLRARRDRTHAAAVWEAWAADDAPLFLFPLQLRTDFQIRAHGPDPDLRETAKAVVRSFALHAPPSARLLVKEHPMDNGLTPWRRLLRGVAARHGAEARVEAIDGGDLSVLLGRAAGLVTVNSTVGLSALRRGVPVKLLGRAIFDREGLVDPQPLDAFWHAPRPPEPGRADTFLKALAWTSLVRGNFDGTGAAEGAANLAERILAPRRHP